MFRRARVAASALIFMLMFVMEGTKGANADSKLPDPFKAGVAEKLYRVDCGHSLANDESVWTPSENVGRSIEFSSTCWLIEHGSEWLLWDTGVPETTLNDPRGWFTLIAAYKATLFINHDKSQTDKLKLPPAFYD